MGELIELTKNLPAELQDVFDTDALAGDLYDGVQAGFAVVSFRGSKWRIKHGGEESLITKEVDGEAVPVPSLEVVIVKASRNISKIYYSEGYTEGDDSAPECFSVDGKVPDSAATNKQAESCAVCPQNVWGSKITPAGKKTKACSDNRRIAVVPLGDITNERYDGPMLLRVPAASLADLAAYGKGMAAKGAPYNAIGTRIGFDDTVAYPKLTFRPIRKLTGEELVAVARIATSDKINAILNVASEVSATTTPAAEPPAVKEKPQGAVSLDFEDDETPAPTTTTKKVAKKKVAKKAAAKKAAPDPVNEEVEDDLDSLLNDLENLQ